MGLVISGEGKWRLNAYPLDGENGLLLAPNVDHLFGRGFIGFEDAGRLIISPVARMVAVGACSGPASLAASGLLSIKGWGIP
jgi:hypothetical protein